MLSSILVLIFVFLFGTIIGSFLNVVALRYNTGLSLQGRSRCFSCGKTLQWYELIPVLSFIFQRGKCASCGSKISWQYPLVEFLTGIIFLGIFYKFVPDFSPFFILHSIFYILTFSLLIVISIYDFKHKIIPNGPVYAFIFLSFLSPLFSNLPSSFWIPASAGMTGGVFSLLHLIAGPILFLPFFLLWFLSQGKWMGFGDAKLALGIGWFLGITEGFTAVCIAFYAGAIVGVGLIIFDKLKQSFKKSTFPLNKGQNRLTMKSEIPFGPFLILGTFLTFFFSINFFSFNFFSF